MTTRWFAGILLRVKSPKNPTTILLDSTVELMFEVYLMRGDCSHAARALMGRPKLDEQALEECARLDDTLAMVYRSLQATVRNIQKLRAKRRARK